MEQTMELEIVEGRKPSVFKRFLVILLITVLLLGGAVYAAGYILFNGPSPYAGQQVVQMVGENRPAVPLIWKLYLNDAQLQEAMTDSEAATQFSVFPVAE